jgi:hypothetical protein
MSEQFNDTLDRTDWLLTDFDWNTWAKTPDGQSLMSDRNAIAAANVEQLAKLLTSLVRAERFCEGVLANAFDEGVLLAATERAERLLRDLVPVRP